MGLSRREFLKISGAAALAEVLAACGVISRPEAPTPLPLPDLPPQDEVIQRSPLNIGRINLTPEAFGGNSLGQKNLDTLQKALEGVGFEKDGVKHNTVALWAPIVTEKILMYAVHDKTPQVFTIGRVYAFHKETQRFVEVPVLLRGKISSDGFELNSVQPVITQMVIAEDRKKRSYEVRAALLQVSENNGEKKIGLEVVNPSTPPLFSYEIESTRDEQKNPVIVGVQKYALDIGLANINGSKATGDSALLNEGIFLRFITPAQEEVTTFKEQPAMVRESQIPKETQDEIAKLIAEKKIAKFEVTTLTVEQWGGGKTTSDAAIIFTPEQIAEVIQPSGSETVKRSVQGKYFLAVKIPKTGQENPSMPVRNIGLSAQENPAWKLVDLGLRFVDNGNGDTYLEVFNEQFGIRFAVAAKIVDKKLQVTGEQMLAYAFTPAKLDEQSSPLQIFSENLQKMFGEMKEVDTNFFEILANMPKDLQGDEVFIESLKKAVAEFDKIPLPGIPNGTLIHNSSFLEKWQFLSISIQMLGRVEDRNGKQYELVGDRKMPSLLFLSDSRFGINVPYAKSDEYLTHVQTTKNQLELLRGARGASIVIELGDFSEEVYQQLVKKYKIYKSLPNEYIRLLGGFSTNLQEKGISLRDPRGSDSELIVYKMFNRFDGSFVIYPLSIQPVTSNYALYPLNVGKGTWYDHFRNKIDQLFYPPGIEKVPDSWYSP